LLDLYGRIRRGRAIVDFNTNPLVAVLELSGLVHEADGRLLVRNRVYRQVFDRRWITENMPDREKRRQRQAYRRGLWRAGLVAAALRSLSSTSRLPLKRGSDTSAGRSS